MKSLGVRPSNVPDLSQTALEVAVVSGEVEVVVVVRRMAVVKHMSHL